tara:strand:- start:323 stop:796 length:474 start_codon:yes stop_codon:yes gene_type:complete
MTVLDIIINPNPILRQQTVPVTQFNDRLVTFINDMYETKDQADGIGLAAPQVGVLDAIFVVGYDTHKKAYINPEITWKSEAENSYDEGCLSIPNIIVEVKRPKSIKIKAQDCHGQWFEEELDGMLATVFQHEFDHLQGKLILDHGVPKAVEALPDTE